MPALRFLLRHQKTLEGSELAGKTGHDFNEPGKDYNWTRQKHEMPSSLSERNESV